MRWPLYVCLVFTISCGWASYTSDPGGKPSGNAGIGFAFGQPGINRWDCEAHNGVLVDPCTDRGGVDANCYIKMGFKCRNDGQLLCVCPIGTCSESIDGICSKN